MINFKSVSKRYPGNITAVRSVSMHVAPGEFLSIVGRSGAGKSTLVRLLMAEEQVTRGTVEVGGWDITHIKKKEIPILRRQMGVVFQDFKLLSKKTVAENVAFALEVCGVSSAKVKESVPSVLSIVGLEKRYRQFPEQLSGGERQRVCIARALVHQPKLLIADEPTGNLDTLHAREIIELLKRINGFGTTVVLVTHNRDIVNTLKRRVVTLDNGAIVSDQAVGRYVL